MKIPVVDRIKTLIDSSPETDMSLSEIAKTAGISVYYMSHIFKKTTSMTVVEYRNAKRLEKAKQLLSKTEMSVTAIALACGFSSQGYFSERFSASCGEPPSAYRKRMREQNSK